MNPFTRTRSKSLRSLGEKALIEEIKRWLGPATPPSPFGLGDDCAVFAGQKKSQVITVDPVIFGRHFDERVSAAQTGGKLLSRNLSDIAAMGATPSVAVVSLALDPQVSVAWLKGFYRGLTQVARHHDVKIVGGDVAQAPGVVVATLTLVGVVSGKRLLTREGAKVGDWLYVTGELGGSRMKHHYSFTPRLAEGAWLARQASVQSMMDVSDGLAKDLACLMPPKATSLIFVDDIPISKAAERQAKRSGNTALFHALTDGEDYELLFALKNSANRNAFEQSWRRRFDIRLSCIGRIASAKTDSTGAIDLSKYSGYEHLR